MKATAPATRRITPAAKKNIDNGNAIAPSRTAQAGEHVAGSLEDRVAEIERRLDELENCPTVRGSLRLYRNDLARAETERRSREQAERERIEAGPRRHTLFEKWVSLRLVLGAGFAVNLLDLQRDLDNWYRRHDVPRTERLADAEFADALAELPGVEIRNVPIPDHVVPTATKPGAVGCRLLIDGETAKAVLQTHRATEVATEQERQERRAARKAQSDSEAEALHRRRARDEGLARIASG